jgi:hypothetical protein
MEKLVLLIDLRNDESNTIRTCVGHICEKLRIPEPWNVDAVLLSDRVALFDQTKAHSVFVQVCAVLAYRRWPYLVAQIQSDAFVLAGTPPEEVANLLANAGISFVPQP